ncbi:MAG: hypothetical protein R3344_10040 [Acidobacteriota bacterium]|nr:hypothetical protein [Acidobacteriota bacterium]
MATAPISNAITERLLTWILSKRDPVAPVDPTTGRHLLPYGRAFRRMVVLMTAVAGGFLVLGIVGTWGDTEALAIVTVVFGTMLGGFVWGLYESHFVRIGFSNDGIYRQVAGRELWVPWSDVVAVEFSESMKWFRFRTRSHGTIRVSVYRNGLGTLADCVENAPMQAPVEHKGTLRSRAHSLF